jgi:glycosyltransferase involved in cell wall biosynthesis
LELSVQGGNNLKSNSIEDNIQNIDTKKDMLVNSGVSVISIINRPNSIDKTFDNYLKQNYKKRELIIILNSSDMDFEKYQKRAEQYNHIRFFKLNQKLNSGECKNFAFNHINFDYIAFFDEDFYASDYLNEAMGTFEKIDCDIVGKFKTYVYFEERKFLAVNNRNYSYENEYSPGVVNSTMVFKKKLLDKLIFPNTSFAENKFQIYCLNYGFKIYSTGRCNYVKHITHDSDFKIDRKDFLEDYRIVARNITDYTDYIAIKNNTDRSNKSKKKNENRKKENANKENKKKRNINKNKQNNRGQNNKNKATPKKPEKESGWGSIRL